MRLVLIKDRTYTVYENRVMLNKWELEEGQPLLTPEEVEQVRLFEQKDKA